MRTPMLKPILSYTSLPKTVSE